RRRRRGDRQPPVEGPGVLARVLPPGEVAGPFPDDACVVLRHDGTIAHGFVMHCALQRERRSLERGPWQTPPMLKPALLLLMVLAVACSQQAATPRSAPERSASSAPANPEAPVAKIGGQPITAGELDKTARPQIARLEADHAEQVYNVRS